MSNDLISFRQHVAKKEHWCVACEHYDYCVNNGLTFEDTPARRAVLEAAKADGWKILKGQKYNRYIAKQDGDFVSVAQRIDMTDLLTELGWWEE